MNNETHIGIAIILDSTRTKTVVGVRPSHVHLAGLHEFPGGKIEADETPQECALREAFEETSLKVTVIEKWDKIVFHHPEKAVVLHPFLCVGDENKELKKPWMWVDILTLDDQRFPEANKDLIARLKELSCPK
jgi:8-oxo-dGTP diphosphatase